MIEAQTPDKAPLSRILDWINEGRFQIPDFQREFDWEPSDIRDLISSIFADYYVGNLLLWKCGGENFESLACEGIYGLASEHKNREFIVLDGQQRLSAIHYAFCAPRKVLPSRKSAYIFYLRVDKWDLSDQDHAFEYAILGEEWKRLIDSKSEELFERHIMPMQIIGGNSRSRGIWWQNYKNYWINKLSHKRSADNLSNQEAEDFEREKDEILSRADQLDAHIEKIMEAYQIAFVKLEKEIETRKICEIFTRLNSKGVKLDIYDLLNALMVPKGVRLKEEWRRAVSGNSKLKEYDSGKLNIQILQTMSVTKQNYCAPKFLYNLVPGETRAIKTTDGKIAHEALISTKDEFLQLWNAAIDATLSCFGELNDLRQYGVLSKEFLPYSSIVPAFCAISNFIKSMPIEEQAAANANKRKWYWASIFGEQYSGSTESTTARDFVQFREWIECNRTPELVEKIIEYVNLLDLRNKKSKSNSVYCGVFNLMFVNGAQDWVTGAYLLKAPIDDHHIVPKSWGEKNLSDMNEIHNSILNRVPLIDVTNREYFGSDLPNVYLPKLQEKLGDSKLRGILGRSFISEAAYSILLRKNFGREDFLDFLEKRQETIKDAIRRLFVDNWLDLDPDVRDLKQEAQNIEISLRHLISEKLCADLIRIPSDILINARKRIASRKSKDPSAYPNPETMKDVLENCDLREIQGIIVNKANWDSFLDIFGSKADFEGRFSFLAEFRNAVSHHREITTQCLVDAKSAIHFFLNAI